MTSRRPSFSLLSAFLLLVVLGGCSAVRPGPFQEFSAGVNKLRTGTDAVLQTDYEWTREGFVDKTLVDPGNTLGQLTVAFPASPDDFSATLTNPPLFLKIRDASQTFHRLNSELATYASLLDKLAGSDVVSQDKFDEFAKDLNGNLTDVAAAFSKNGVAVPPQISSASGLLSVAASEGFRAYIEHKRKGKLAGAINATQPVIEAWSTVAISGIKIASLDLQTEYLAKNGTLTKEFAKTTKASEKREIGLRLFALAEAVIDARNTLASLRDTYASMPKAHKSLADAAEDGKLDLAELKEFYDHARHVKELYDTLQKSKQEAN